MGYPLVLLLHPTAVNFLLSEEEVHYIGKKLDQVFAQKTRISKMNISFRYILSNNETVKHRYCYSSDNSTVLLKPSLLENFQRFKLMKQDIFNTDSAQKITKFRDSTKWSFFCLTNILMHASHISRLLIGLSDSAEIPDMIKPSSSF